VPTGSTNPNDPALGRRFRPLQPVSSGTGIPGVLTPNQKKASAAAAASNQRKKYAGQGRRGTILGGFRGSGSPTIRPATLLGR